MRRFNCWGDSSARRSSQLRCLGSPRTSIECSPIPCVGVRLHLMARRRKPLSLSTVLYVEWGRLGEIGDLYVLPEHRRKGLARRLVEHAKAWCRAQGCSAVTVTITSAGEQRHRLSHFYARLGFAQSDRMSALAILDA